MTETLPIISSDPRVQAHYEKCRAEGTSHALAEMFAFRLPPMSNTDREFLEARENGRQFQDNQGMGDWYKNEAKKAGVNVTGKVYLSSLTRFPGDPQAWVSGRGDVKDRIESRPGWTVNGSVKAAGAPPGENVRVRVAPDLVQEHAVAAVENDLSGDLARKPFREVLEMTEEKLAPPAHWK